MTVLPECGFEVWAGQAQMTAPDVPCSERPGAWFAGGVHLDLEGFDLPAEAHRLSALDAASVAAGTSLVSGLHEMTEWLRVDGQRVFIPHTPDYLEWPVLVSVTPPGLRQLPRPARRW